jgi:OH-DDVA oxygenase
MPDDVLRSGTSEMRNWIVVAGALQATALDAELVGYEPCYRAEAGTGCAMAFMTWQVPGDKDTA